VPPRRGKHHQQRLRIPAVSLTLLCAAKRSCHQPSANERQCQRAAVRLNSFESSRWRVFLAPVTPVGRCQRLGRVRGWRSRPAKSGWEVERPKRHVSNSPATLSQKNRSALGRFDGAETDFWQLYRRGGETPGYGARSCQGGRTSSRVGIFTRKAHGPGDASVVPRWARGD